MESTQNYFYLFVVILLSIGFFIALFLLAQSQIVMISPGACPKIRGDYGVSPGTNGKNLLSCGPNTNEPCVFPAKNLSEAMMLCDSQPVLCNEFSYNNVTKLMYVVDSKSGISKDGATDLYIRQIPIVVE